MVGINPFLQECPIVGYDTWFKLEPRSSTSKVQGECHLILKLFTNQVGEFRLYMHMKETAPFLSSLFPFRGTRLLLRPTQTSPFTRNC